jgi:hypothetical protein
MILLVPKLSDYLEEIITGHPREGGDLFPHSATPLSSTTVIPAKARIYFHTRQHRHLQSPSSPRRRRSCYSLPCRSLMRSMLEDQ